MVERNTVITYFRSSIVCSATTPRRCAPHPSSPEEGTTLDVQAFCFFNVFARRRGDFAEMMGVRGEGRGACSPELTSSQTSRHAVPTASTGVFSCFFQHSWWAFVFISQRTRLYVVVKNREKRVTGGGRQGDRCEATGGRWRQGDRCEATGALWVAKVWERMCASSGFWLLYTLRSSFTPYPCEAFYTPKVLSAKLRKNLETSKL